MRSARIFLQFQVVFAHFSFDSSHFLFGVIEFERDLHDSCIQIGRLPV